MHLKKTRPIRLGLLWAEFWDHFLTALLAFWAPLGLFGGGGLIGYSFWFLGILAAPLGAYTASQIVIRKEVTRITALSLFALAGTLFLLTLCPKCTTWLIIFRLIQGFWVGAYRSTCPLLLIADLNESEAITWSGFRQWVILFSVLLAGWVGCLSPTVGLLCLLGKICAGMIALGAYAIWIIRPPHHTNGSLCFLMHKDSLKATVAFGLLSAFSYLTYSMCFQILVMVAPMMNMISVQNMASQNPFWITLDLILIFLFTPFMRRVEVSRWMGGCLCVGLLLSFLTFPILVRWPFSEILYLFRALWMMTGIFYCILITVFFKKYWGGNYRSFALGSLGIGSVVGHFTGWIGLSLYNQMQFIECFGIYPSFLSGLCLLAFIYAKFSQRKGAEI